MPGRRREENERLRDWRSMANTRTNLKSIAGNLDESIGNSNRNSAHQLSPVAHPKDIGRRSLREFGKIAIDQVIADPRQPRRSFDTEEIGSLSNSIREKGQLQPIRVRWSDADEKWIIVAGERRFRACRMAGLEYVECHFADQPLTRIEVLEQQLIENLQREDLKPIEEARALDELRRIGNLSSKQLAETIRVNPSKVSRSLALLKLPEDIQREVESGKIAARAAYELSKLSSPKQMRAAIAETDDRKEQLTVKDAQRRVRQRRGKPAAKSRGVRQSFMSESGWKIVVTSPRKGNYYEIEEALVEALEEVRLRIDNNVQLS